MPLTMSGFTYKFIAGEADAPTLLLLHGTGGDENDLLDLGKLLLPGANLLSPRGKVIENGALRFFRRFPDGTLDVEDLKLRVPEVVQFVRDAATHYQLDASRIYAVGFSNGANTAAAMLLMDPSLLAGAVLLRAMIPFSPETLPDLAGVPVLLLSGQGDPILSPSKAAELAMVLQQSGAALTHEWLPTGHGLMQRDIDLAAAWLGKQTGREAAHAV